MVLYYSWIMQAHLGFCFAKIVFLPLQIYQMKTCKTFSLLLPSHNCIIIHNVQFSRCIWISSVKRLNEASCFQETSVNLFWWRLAGSNRWPPACKAGALPAELNPHILFRSLPIESPAKRVSIGEEKPICKGTFRFQRNLQSVLRRSGGPKWTRTIDLTIISRVL